VLKSRILLVPERVRNHLLCSAAKLGLTHLLSGGDYLARASHYRSQRQLDDFTFPALFAQRMKHYCKTHNVGPKVRCCVLHVCD